MFQIRQNATKEGQNKAREIELAAQQDQLKARTQIERDNTAARKRLEEHESRLSKREDILDTVLSLKRPDDYEPTEGARFEVHFEKCRGIYGEEASALRRGSKPAMKPRFGRCGKSRT